MPDPAASHQVPDHRGGEEPGEGPDWQGGGDQNGRARKTNKPQGDAQHQSAPWLERAASGVGLILALLTLGFIGWEAWHDQATPPALTVETTRVVQSVGGYTVHIRVLNRSSRTASHVEVAGELKRRSEVVETSRATFNFVPGDGHADGGLFFRNDPRSLTLDVRALGYARP